MNEELKIKITAVVDQAKQAIGAAREALKQFGQQTDEAAVSQQTLSQKVKEQKSQLTQLKKEYDNIVSVQGKESSAALACSQQISILSASYATNLASLRGASASSNLFTASALGAAGASGKMGVAAKQATTAYNLFTKAVEQNADAVADLGADVYIGLWDIIDKIGDAWEEASEVFGEDSEIADSLYEIYEEAERVNESFDKFDTTIHKTSKTIEKELEKSEKALKDTEKQAEKTTTAMEDIKTASESVGSAAITAFNFLTTAVVGSTIALVGLGESTRDYRTEQAKLITAFEASGHSAETAKETYNDLYRVLGDTSQATEAANLLAKLTTNEQELAEWTNISKGVYATFGESLPIESLAEAANETAKTGQITGALADALNWAGVNEAEFAEQLFWANSEAEREKLIRTTLNGLYDEAALGYEENAASILAANEAQAKLTESLAAIGGAMEPINSMFKELGAEILAELVPYIQEFSENNLPQLKEILSGVADSIGKVMGWIADNWELILTLTVTIGAITAALTALSVIMTVVNAVMAASPVTWIVAGIAALVAIFVVLWNKCDAFRNFWIGLWDILKSAFSSFAETLKPLWDAIVGMFQEAWELIKVVWDLVEPYFKNIWNKIEVAFSVAFEVISLPFKIAWEQIKFIWDVAVSYFTTLINQIKLTFSVVKNILSGNFKGAWEDIKKIFSNWGSFFKGLWDKVKSLFSNIAQTIGSSISNVVKTAINGVLSNAVNIINGFIRAINLAIGIINAIPGVNIKKINDLQVPKLERGGVLKKGQIGLLEGNGAEAVVPLEKNTEWLDRISERLLKGLGGSDRPVVLQVDGKTFAKTVINTVNADTRQKGKIGLNIV